VAKHLAQCETCHQLFSDTLRRQRGSEGVSFTLAPEFWLRHEHLDYEQLVGLAEKTLDTTDHEVIDIHLAMCPTCREDVSGFLAFRQQIEPELRVHYGPIVKERASEKLSWLAWWRALARKPAYVAALVLIGIGLVMAVLVLKRRAANLEARQTSPSQTNTGAVGQTPTPDNQAVKNVLPTPAPIPSAQLPGPASSPQLTVKNRQSVKQPENAGAVVALNDVARTVTVDRAGRVSGLDDIPATTRRVITEALLAERLEPPKIVRDLAGENSTLRGSNRGQSFKLLSPARAVIIDRQPVFKWEKLSGANAYRVYVLDSRGHQLVKSEDLPSLITEWRPGTALERGNLYSWVVIAVVNRKEIVSPGAAAPAMKFQILSASDLQKLSELKATRSHLVLGVFYAKVGLLAEGEREFQKLLLLNPKSGAASNLLRSVQLLQDSR
jgi:hypothetical protein